MSGAADTASLVDETIRELSELYRREADRRCAAEELACALEIKLERVERERALERASVRRAIDAHEGTHDQCQALTSDWMFRGDEVGLRPVCRRAAEGDQGGEGASTGTAPLHTRSEAPLSSRDRTRSASAAATPNLDPLADMGTSARNTKERDEGNMREAKVGLQVSCDKRVEKRLGGTRLRGALCVDRAIGSVGADRAGRVTELLEELVELLPVHAETVARALADELRAVADGCSDPLAVDLDRIRQAADDLEDLADEIESAGGRS